MASFTLAELRRQFRRRVLILRVRADERRNLFDTGIKPRDIEHVQALIRSGRLEKIPRE